MTDPTSADLNPNPSQIYPVDLTQKVTSLRLITQTHNLLSEAHLPIAAHGAILASQEFLRHPDADTVQELRAFREQQSKEDKQNG